jgi:hypothetical protein
MQELDEVYADSGEPVAGGVSRRTALKVGGLGLAGAVAAFLPGWAAAGVRKQKVFQTCSGVNSTLCQQYPIKCGNSNNCTCITVYGTTGTGPGTSCAAGFAGEFNCSSSNSCVHSKCAKGYFCAAPKSTCCSLPVCVPLCSGGGT